MTDLPKKIFQIGLFIYKKIKDVYNSAMEIMVILGLIAVILGLIGSVAPALPGPILSFLGIIFLFIAKPGEVSWLSLIAFGLGTILLILLGYFGPILGAKYFGASKRGLAGALIGGLVGLIFYPPLGIFIGALLGAYLAENYAGKNFKAASKSALGVLVGSVFVLIMQIIYSLMAVIYFLIILF